MTAAEIPLHPVFHIGAVKGHLPPAPTTCVQIFLKMSLALLVHIFLIQYCDLSIWSDFWGTVIKVLKLGAKWVGKGLHWFLCVVLLCVVFGILSVFICFILTDISCLKKKIQPWLLQKKASPELRFLNRSCVHRWGRDGRGPNSHQPGENHLQMVVGP